MVGAGTSYGVLARQLHEQGFALHNLASLPHVTVASAVATGTHGSDNGNGSLSSALVGLELVVADGSLQRVMWDDKDFDATVVGLGAFGIVTRVHLRITPTFDVRQDAFVGIPWDALLTDFDTLFSAVYRVSVITKWGGDTTSHLWFKTRLDGPWSREPPFAHLGLEPGLPYCRAC